MKAHSSLEPVCDDPRMRHIIHKADGPCECWRCHQLQQQQQQQTPVSTAHSEPTQIGCMQDGCLSQALTYRIDMVNPALEALHRHSSLNSAPSGLQPRPDHVCILGFPSDEGTARNGGRLGGFLGPAHFRQFGTPSMPRSLHTFITYIAMVLSTTFPSITLVRNELSFLCRSLLFHIIIPSISWMLPYLMPSPSSF